MDGLIDAMEGRWQRRICNGGNESRGERMDTVTSSPLFNYFCYTLSYSVHNCPSNMSIANIYTFAPSFSPYPLFNLYHPTSSPLKLPMTLFAHSVPAVSPSASIGKSSPSNSCSARYCGTSGSLLSNLSSTVAFTTLNLRDRRYPGHLERRWRCSCRYQASKSASWPAAGCRAAEMSKFAGPVEK